MGLLLEGVFVWAQEPGAFGARGAISQSSAAKISGFVAAKVGAAQCFGFPLQCGSAFLCGSSIPAQFPAGLLQCVLRMISLVSSDC